MEDLSFTIQNFANLAQSRLYVWGPLQTVQRSFVFIEETDAGLGIAEIAFVEISGESAKSKAENAGMALIGHGATFVEPDPDNPTITAPLRRPVVARHWNLTATLDIISFDLIKTVFPRIF